MTLTVWIDPDRCGDLNLAAREAWRMRNPALLYAKRGSFTSLILLKNLLRMLLFFEDLHRFTEAKGMHDLTFS